MNHILNWYLLFQWKVPFLSILDTFWAIFGHFSHLTSINDSLTIELNYFFQLNQQNFFELNNILNKSWANQYWIEYGMTHFLAKFKHRIESDGVSNKAKQSSKVVCIFYSGPKTLSSSKHYPYLISSFDETTKKTCFSVPKGAISAKSAKSEKGVRLCYTACMGLPWKI